MLMAGVGWERQGISIDVAYSYLWAKDAHMGTDYAPFTGTFENSSHTIGLSGSFQFYGNNEGMHELFRH
jgi:hypothetical protein